MCEPDVNDSVTYMTDDDTMKDFAVRFPSTFKSPDTFTEPDTPNEPVIIGSNIFIFIVLYLHKYYENHI